MEVGIELFNCYVGCASVNVNSIFSNRDLNVDRMKNLDLIEKSVALPCEDAITNAVNAAKPIISRLSEDQIRSIEMLVVATESGIDFGKSVSTYVHHYLGLSKNCRLFEIKQACYGGVAGLQMAAHYVNSAGERNVKVLVIASDTARSSARMTYAEPSQGTGAAAMLVSNKPDVLALDLHASGLYSYEVMDTCRPTVELETGDPDLSLLSYMDCLEGSFKNYLGKVDGVAFPDTFERFVFHTPFAGMIKGAYRSLSRKFSSMPKERMEAEFESRVSPGLAYSRRVGNIYSASVFMGLCSLIDNSDVRRPFRIGVFSYGSGCSSEFFSGVVAASAKQIVSQFNVAEKIDLRYPLKMREYDDLLDLNAEWYFGIKDKTVDISSYERIYEAAYKGKELLRLDAIAGYHRKYSWS